MGSKRYIKNKPRIKKFKSEQDIDKALEPKEKCSCSYEKFDGKKSLKFKGYFNPYREEKEKEKYRSQVKRHSVRIIRIFRRKEKR